MSQLFKLRYDQLREGDPTKADAAPKETGSGEHEYYETPGHARNLCLVWPDGRRMFFNYAYLVSGELSLDNEKNIVVLNFSSHSVLLKGYGLETLFMNLLNHLPRLLVAIDPRYTYTENEALGILTDIVIEKKE